jgi:hypothetical protein
MDWLSELLRRIWMLMRRQQFDADLEEEMRLHLELREQEKIQAGLSPREARQAASRRFGNATLLKEKSHLAWGWEWFESFVQDTAYGSRAMLRSPYRLRFCFEHWQATKSGSASRDTSAGAERDGY